MCSNVARFSIGSSIYLAASLMAQVFVSLQWLINYVSSSNYKTTIIHHQGNYQACKRFSPCTTKKLFLVTTKVLWSMDKASSLVAQELLPLQWLIEDVTSYIHEATTVHGENQGTMSLNRISEWPYQIIFSHVTQPMFCDIERTKIRWRKVNSQHFFYCGTRVCVTSMIDWGCFFIY